jgi:RNA polymerase sigma-70 factor (ECF subfamily)
MPTMVEVFVERRPSRDAGNTDESAFADLYARTYAPLVAYCRRYCPPGYDAEDIAQEAFSRAWSSWDRYSPSRPFWPWVATIARRLCVDYWRRDERSAARDTRVAIMEPEVDAQPDELTEAADECRIAVGAFRRLRPDHQRIVGLRDIEGWSYEDIARFEGVTVESVRGSLRRARVSLRKSYESLAKGVPALVVLRGFRRVRLRVAERLAALHGQLGSSGLATTRLGEWVVSLVALSVAAVTFGPTNSGSTPAAPSSRPSVAQPAGLAGAAGAVAADRAVSKPAPAAGAGHGSSGSAGTSLGTPGANTPTLPSSPVPIPGTPSRDSADNRFLSFTASPTYASRGQTIFGVAAGNGNATCANPCVSLFRSSDGGVSWSALPAVGLAGNKILLPPAYPDDRRIFATDGVALSVSLDDGQTFAPLAPGTGVAVMSPDFSDNDPRILLPNVPGSEYNDQVKAVVPLAFTPPPRNSSAVYTFAFSPGYRADHTLFVGASVPDSVRGAQASVVYRCPASTCGDAVPLPSGAGAPSLLVPGGRAAGNVFAWSSGVLYRSGSSRLAFEVVVLPQGLTLTDLVAAPGGALYAQGVVMRADQTFQSVLYQSADAGKTWEEVAQVRAMNSLISAFAALPDGTLLISMLEGDVLCSRDRGASWTRHC